LAGERPEARSFSNEDRGEILGDPGGEAMEDASEKTDTLPEASLALSSKSDEEDSRSSERPFGCLICFNDLERSPTGERRENAWLVSAAFPWLETRRTVEEGRPEVEDVRGVSGAVVEITGIGWPAKVVMLGGGVGV